MPRPSTLELAALLLRAYDATRSSAETKMTASQQEQVRVDLRAARTALLTEPMFTSQQVHAATVAVQTILDIDVPGMMAAEAPKVMRAVLAQLNPLEG